MCNDPRKGSKGFSLPVRFLKPVKLSERCLLHEVLLWVAFQRPPLATYSDIEEDLELRDAEGDLEQYGYAARHPRIFYRLTEEECAGAGLPLHPDTAMSMGFDCDWEGRDRRQWSINYESVIEYPATRIYLALREGKLAASGKLLGDHDRERAMGILEAQDQHLWDLPTVEIPSHFWSPSGIDWSSNAARNNHEHYCWIRCQTEAVLKTFPWENREPAAGVERVGENFILTDSSEKPQQSGRPRGRPSFPWDAFHLEVTDLLLRGTMPAKKESAIEHFRDWFKQNLSVRPCRTSIGDRLKPYYDRFVKPADKN
jgi:hypothetical protein